MKKAKIYRTIGWTFTILGIVKYAAYFFMLMPYKYARLIENPSAGLFPAVYGSLMLLTVQYFLWIGIIFHWRADKNEHPGKGSFWEKMLLGYIVLGIWAWAITHILSQMPANR